LTKVLVIGPSYARDWANVLLESPYRGSIALSYLERSNDWSNVEKMTDWPELARRMAEADLVFFSTPDREILASHGLVSPKLWAIGAKSFGINSGYFYNQRGEGYCHQRTALGPGFAEKNDRLRAEWGSRYLDIIGKLIDSSRTVPVFTPDCRFISQDAEHLTPAGARYIAALFAGELAALLGPRPPAE
jgi:hypothetical protein